MVDGKNAIAHGPPKDRVLWQYRVGLTALRQGDYEEAKRQFDDAITRIGGIYSSDAAAKKARSYFHHEAKKTFIGEPYERVMAYYYRGLLYWRDGEVDNARACFRSAQLQDADTEAHEYAADYVLLDYLDGFATVKLGGEAADELGRAQKVEVFNQDGALLDTRTISNFENGKYFTWRVTGRVTFRITRVLGPNAVLSGIFFE